MTTKKDLKKTGEATPSLVVVWTTVATSEAAKEIAAGLLEGGLAGCVQVDSAITSHYVWEGRRCAETELRVVIKTTADASSSVVDWLAENHPYDEPQVIVMPVAAASPGYAQWVGDSITQASD